MIEWEPKGVSSLEEEALLAIKDTDNCVVEAGPGSGKTELLAQKVDYLFSTGKSLEPKKILALSFKKDAAANLKTRVKQRYGNEFSRRFTSLTFAAFEKRILDQFLMSLPSDMRPNKDYIIVNKKVADGKNKIAYKDITRLSKHIIKTNVYIRRAIRSTYDFVFIDEFQDTTTDQYSLLKECFLGTNTKMTAVGDKNQSIMVWAGADEHIFDKFKCDFYPNEYRLLINYRSAEKLVEFQKYFKYKAMRLGQNYYDSNQVNNMEGDIRLYEFDNDIDEASILADEILVNIEKGVQPSEICILAKMIPKNYAKKVIGKLKDKNINSRIEDDYQDMLKNPVISLILDIILISGGQKDADAWENITKFFISEDSRDDISGDGYSYEDYYSEIEALIENIKRLIESDIICNTDMDNLLLKIFNIINIKIVDLSFMAYMNETELFSLLKKFALLFYIEYIKSNKSWLDAVNNFKGENTIPIMTIHKSKGLEFEHVYFIGLEDAAFKYIDDPENQDINAVFVAISRAKKRFTFTHSRDRNNIRQNNEKIKEIYDIISTSKLVDKIDWGKS